MKLQFRKRISNPNGRVDNTMTIADKLLLGKIKYWPIHSTNDIRAVIDCIKANFVDSEKNIQITTFRKGSQLFVKLTLNAASNEKNEQIIDALSFSRFWDLFWTNSNVQGQHCFKIDFSKFPDNKEIYCRPKGEVKYVGTKRL